MWGTHRDSHGYKTGRKKIIKHKKTPDAFTYLVQHTPDFICKLPRADFQVEYFPTVRYTSAQQLQERKLNYLKAHISSTRLFVTVNVFLITKEFHWSEHKHLKIERASGTVFAWDDSDGAIHWAVLLSCKLVALNSSFEQLLQSDEEMYTVLLG